MKEAILGIDVGTSSIKCNLYGIHGEDIISCSSKYVLNNPRPGILEIDPVVLWKTVVKSMLRINELNKQNYNIIAVGICAIMIMPVLLDSKNDIVRPIIHWLDERLRKQCLEIKKEGKDKIISTYSGSVITGESTVNALFWIKRHEPEVYKKIGKFVMLKDYIRFKLTGEIISDFGDASGSLMLDTRKWTWSTEVLSELGFNKRIFPDLAKPADIGGYITKEASDLTGLKEGTPVAVGTGDGIATIFGLGIFEDGQTGVTVGSAGVIGTSAIKFPKDDKYRTYTFCHPFCDRWYSMMATAASGEVLRWYKDSIVKDNKISYKDLDIEAENSPPGTDSLIFLPYILGSRNPHSNPKATGMFIGIRHQHDRSYLTRAVIEGISFELLDLFEVQKEILKKKSIDINSMKISGGIVRSVFWLQLLANIFQTDLITTKVEELGTLGSSIIAAAAVNVYDNLEIAIQSMVINTSKIEYDKKYKKIYENKFLIFRKMYKALETKLDFLL